MTVDSGQSGGQNRQMLMGRKTPNDIDLVIVTYWKQQFS